MHKKRYRERLSHGGQEKRRIVFRVILTVVLAISFSVLFSFIGITLGRNADKGLDFTTPPGGSNTQLPEDEVTTAPDFDFKDVKKVKAVVLSLGKDDTMPYNTVSIHLTDGEGKLTYLSSVSSLMYGSSFSTTMKPIAAAVNSADIKSNAISACFKPFVLDDNQDFADACSLALIKELSGQDINEILLERHDVSDKLITEASEYVSGVEDIDLGILLPNSVFDGIVSEKEKAIKRYYSLFDFCVVDMSHISFDGEAEGTDGSDDALSSGYTEAYAIINENALLIAKYSLRIRFYAPTDEALEEVKLLISELGIESYDIIS